MPVSLANMAARSTSATITTPVGDIVVGYDPNKVTTKAVAQMDTDLVQRAAALAGIIHSWDVYEDEAMTQLAPIDADHLESFGIDVLAALMLGVMGDMRKRPN